MPLLIPPMPSIALISEAWKNASCVEKSDHHNRLDADAESQGVVTGVKLTSLLLDYDAVDVPRGGIQEIKNFADQFADLSRLGLTPELPEWFDVVVSAKKHAILIRMGLHNRRFLGYQMENQEWVELGSGTTDTRLIPGSCLFVFDVDYDAFRGTVAVGQKRKYRGHNKRQLAHAVKMLSETHDSQKRKWALIILIKRISESLKASRILESLLGAFISKDQDGPAASPDLVRASEHGWGLLSHGSVVSREPRLPQLIGPGKFLYPDYPLVEVFSVVIDNIDGNVDLYGIIAVDYAFGRQYIYNKKREESESISQGHNLLLTGPTRSITADDPFSITVDLKDRKSDDEVCEGFVSWDTFSMVHNRYDKLLATKFDGRSGSATVNFIVFSDSVEATFEVTLLKGDGEKPANVHGFIRAGSAYDSSTYSSVLFQKEIDNDNDIELCPGQLIPLSRSLVAVDINSRLEVSAKLYLSQKDEIANGAAVFPAQRSGTYEEFITGRCGVIRVKVTWNTQ